MIYGRLLYARDATPVACIYTLIHRMYGWSSGHFQSVVSSSQSGRNFSKMQILKCIRRKSLTWLPVWCALHIRWLILVEWPFAFCMYSYLKYIHPPSRWTMVFIGYCSWQRTCLVSTEFVWNVVMSKCVNVHSSLWFVFENHGLEAIFRIKLCTPEFLYI